MVSIHAPYIGSDGIDVKEQVSVYVSIHAPYIGSDLCQELGVTVLEGFNPRSLHRERRRIELIAGMLKMFQSTLPT